MSESKIVAPWTAEQVWALHCHQHGPTHPYTCGNGHGPLIATVDGWHCPRLGCDYEQTWAWRVDAEPAHPTTPDPRSLDSTGANPSSDPLEPAIEAALDAYRATHPDGWMGLLPVERVRVPAAVRAAAPIIAAQALRRAADEIVRELICCDVYERDKDTDRAGDEHAICFWAGAARALVLDHAARAEAVSVDGE